MLSFLGLSLLAPFIALGETFEDRAKKLSPAAPSVWQNYTYRWFYNPQYPPAWLDGELARGMVVEAARKWEVCGVRMAYQGETGRAPGTMDGVNVVGWSLAIPHQLRGITMGRSVFGRLLERDIAFRSDRKEFENHPRLLRKVIAHEFGHALGLTHSSRCDDVMT